ncbi:MAG: hypothetical protein AAB775_01155 [Patescibacteria group bacterium]
MTQTFKNTRQRGSVRYIVFKEEGSWYGVALEFNIVVEENDPELALFKLFEAIRGYLKSFRKIGGARPHTLNQKVDPEYEDIWNTMTAKKVASSKPTESPYPVYTFGRKMIQHA